MSVLPNASVLFMFTFSDKKDENKENILFGYQKQIEDIAPKQLWMYDKYGKDGKAKTIFGDHNIKQWFCISSDFEINEIKNKLINQGNCKIAKTIFNSPGNYIQKEIPENNIYKVNDYCECYKIGIKYYTCESFDNFLQKNNLLNFYFEIPGNLRRISQIMNDFSSIIYPYGFLKINELDKYINNRITFIENQRTFKYDYRGITNKDFPDNDPNNFKGFIQKTNDLYNDLSVAIVSHKEELFNKKNYTSINEKTGLWELKTETPLNSGIFCIYDNNKKQIICAENFHLMGKANIDVNIISNSYNIKDLYGREFSYSDQILKMNILRPEPKIWFKESSLGDSRKIEMELSDYFSTILQYCSPKILIYDPYFIGALKTEQNQIKLSPSQRIFINAIIYLLLKTNTEEICFLYSKKREDKIFENSNYNIYEKLFKEIKKIRPVNIKINSTNRIFHDRHILKIDPKTYDVFTYSSSINGLLTSEELKISPEEDINKSKIYGRILEIWEKRNTGVIIP